MKHVMTLRKLHMGCGEGLVGRVVSAKIPDRRQRVPNFAKSASSSSTGKGKR